MAQTLVPPEPPLPLPPMREAIRLFARRAATLEARGELLSLVETWQQLGQACALNRDLDAALRWFSHALELAELVASPRVSELYRSMGWVSGESGDGAACRLFFARAEAVERLEQHQTPRLLLEVAHADELRADELRADQLRADELRADEVPSASLILN